MTVNPQTIIYAIDLLGTAAFAFAGALRAVERRPDFVGMLILAGATGVGGSILRDVILNRDVAVLRDWGYLTAILFATTVTFFHPASVGRREEALRYFDAIGLGVFSAITASVCWQTPGITPLSVLFLATITGCAGGTIRDVLIQRPSIVLLNEVYVTPVIIGAAGLMLVRSLGAGELAGSVTAMSVTTGLRVMAIRWNWRLPRILVADTGDGNKRQPEVSAQPAPWDFEI